MRRRFELLLFSVDPSMIQPAVAAGIGGILVDWECMDKERRQAWADTEINRHTAEDLRRVRACTPARVICRLNNGPTTAAEVETAIAEGADELLLPMVRSVREVEAVLRQAADRCGVGILVETVAALEIAEELAKLPLSRVYVGLNDLSIERRTSSLFAAVADGTVERIRRCFDVPFGFGGLTLPEMGHPVPCRLLIGEMARLDCSFSFLRRSFHRDVRGREMAVEVPRLQAAILAARGRSSAEVARDSEELEAAIRQWAGPGLRAREIGSNA